MADQTVSYRNLTSYRLKKQLSDAPHGPFQAALYTHTAGREAVGTILDYKKKNRAYRTLMLEADLNMLINIKHDGKKPNATAPDLFTIIDKSNRLIVMREYVAGVPLSKLNQGAKVAAYLECVKELGALFSTMPQDQKAVLPRISERSMNQTFSGLLFKAFLKDQGLLPQLLKLAYVFYRVNSVGSPQTLANRALSAANVICTSNRLYITNFKHAAVAPKGTDEALFPQLYYREIGTDTMRAYLDSQCDTPKHARRFTKLAAYFAVRSGDLTYMQILADSIIPYINSAFKPSTQKARNLSLAVEPRS